MPTVSFYKIGLLLSLVALSSSLAGLGYYYQNRTVGLNNQVASLNTQNDSQHDQIDSLKGQIANLTQQIKNLSSNIDQLQSTNTQLLIQIIQLRNQLGGTGGLCSSGKLSTRSNMMLRVPQRQTSLLSCRQFKMTSIKMSAPMVLTRSLSTSFPSRNLVH